MSKQTRQNGWTGIFDAETEPQDEKLDTQNLHPSTHETSNPELSHTKQRLLAPSQSVAWPDESPVGDHLAEKLGQAATIEAASDPSSWWSEYRQLLLTIFVGGILLAASWRYNRTPPDIATNDGPPPQKAALATPQKASKSQKESTSVSRSPTTLQTNSTQAKTKVIRRKNQPVTAAVKQAEVVRPSPQPVLSVVSTPPNALVEIDGTVYGKTPLIMPCPRETKSLRIRLKLNRHEVWDEHIAADESGHFTVNAALIPQL